ncbi:MOSC domain-containing protein [Plantactinospora sp. BB1]|uniref:MOSC domain-containing protein n=1 Tax=Plantactinospora sp. BB1 TaxID=2071627 RepID=UPI000D174E56|nr:MOSC N-terminal beta barrel domain-containing protein [Plantactinospora sp. BB1]AVT37474.1 MOSC domain-containing protein [Plantactinospora sp. BB1]
MSDRVASRAPHGVVRELITYPIKGCAAMPVARSQVTPAGLAHDRSFMVVDPEGVFRSQRRDPGLALVRPVITPDGTRLTLRAPGADSVELAVDLDAARRDVLLFGVRYQGIDQGETAAGWLSEVLGAPSRLVRVPPEHDRVTDGEIAGTSGYADGSAVHLLSRSTLDLLNERLLGRGAVPVPMSRFRPNIVVDGWDVPHTEDLAGRISVGSVGLAFAKLASRCVVTTVEQRSGRKTGPEPLRTLADYRRIDGGIAFGVKYAVPEPGVLGVGDEVVVDRWQRPPRLDRVVPTAPAVAGPAADASGPTRRSTLVPLGSRPTPSDEG